MKWPSCTLLHQELSNNTKNIMRSPTIGMGQGMDTQKTNISHKLLNHYNIQPIPIKQHQRAIGNEH
jgi:hypothetical protein